VTSLEITHRSRALPCGGAQGGGAARRRADMLAEDVDAVVARAGQLWDFIVPA